MAKSKELFNKPSFYLAGELSQEHVKELLSFLKVCFDKQEKECVIFIDSNGGDIEVALSICDILKTANIKVIGCTLATCYSSAFSVLQSCDHKIAMPHSLLMYHHGSFGFGQVDAREASSTYEASKKQFKYMDKIAGYKSKGDLNSGRYLTSKESLKHGYVDEILGEDIE